MFAKKDFPASIQIPEYFKELEYLYARRSAIDSLIESLEEYDRYRMTAGEQGELATA
jgi:hypothetical protein